MLATPAASMQQLFALLLQLLVCLVRNSRCTLQGSVAEQTAPPSVQLPLGRISGQLDHIAGRDLHVYLGVPYAQPPTGGLRFRPPLAPTQPWSDVQAYTQLSEGCPQPSKYVQFQRFAGTGHIAHGEDCLRLNVWAPQPRRHVLASDYDPRLKPLLDQARAAMNHTGAGRLMPVLVFIHGGALLFNSASELKYFDGKALAAAADAVVVTLNYRLGAFGFLYGGNQRFPGNLGLLDQLEAIKWVQTNARLFGGDPTRMTLFGESAGAWSVGLHLLSPLSRDRFEQAMMMSGSPLDPLLCEPEQRALAKLPLLAQRLNCSLSAPPVEIAGEFERCLQNAPIELLMPLHFDEEIIDLSKNSYRLAFQPVYGQRNSFLPDSPTNLLRAMQPPERKQPLVIGTLTNEGQDTWTLWKQSHMVEPAEPRTKPQFEQAARDYLNSTLDLAGRPLPVDDLVYMYFAAVPDEPVRQPSSEPPATNFAAQKALYTMLSDLVFRCPSQEFASRWHRSDRPNTFAYKITYESTSLGSQQFAPWCDQTRFGPCHMVDLQYVFGRPFLFLRAYTALDRQMSLELMDELANLAESGRPSWPAYRTIGQLPQDLVLQLEWQFNPASGSHLIAGDRAFECAIWRRLLFP